MNEIPEDPYYSMFSEAPRVGDTYEERGAYSPELMLVRNRMRVDGTSDHELLDFSGGDTSTTDKTPEYDTEATEKPSKKNKLDTTNCRPDCRWKFPLENAYSTRTGILLRSYRGRRSEI